MSKNGEKITLETIVNKDPKVDPQVGKIRARLNNPEFESFKLSGSFVEKYSKLNPPFGFNGLGELVYRRTYSRLKENNSNEEWYETVERVINGTYNLQKRWIEDRGLRWNNSKGQRSAQEMYDKIYKLKFTPPGRGLWAMGSQITEERGLYAALNNCAFVSTDNLKEDLAAPFTFLMDASMLGVGVGFDTRGAKQITIKSPNEDINNSFYNIPDTREGWVESTRLLLESYFLGTSKINFGYDDIRPAGELIKGFGGLSSGSEPLKELHNNIRNVLDKEVGDPISETSIVDIQNYIGKCVVAGNVRRTAEIVFGDPYSEEYLDLKNYEKNPQRMEHGWASNNSIFAELGMDYSDVVKRTKKNGEPGFAWLENMRNYGRMIDPPNGKDHRAKGGNPCLEQTLESYELCCLVETFPFNHETKEEYLRTLKFAYLYAKTVTLGETHWPETNRVMLRNRRIGTSMTGIAQFIENRSLDELIDWSKEGYDTIQKYDEIYSDWLAIPKSIKTTSIKPSGSVSLLAGATPGIHFPEDRYYIRRMRLGKNSELIDHLKERGYKVEQDVADKSSVVVEVPVYVGSKIRTTKEVSMWEKVGLAAKMQKYWADNQVSCTVSFNPETEGDQIKYALDHFQYDLKGISFLPIQKDTYAQMPYEGITKKKYNELISKIKPLNFKKIYHERAEVDKFCDGDTCEIKPS